MRQRLLACLVALALLGAGPPVPIALQTLGGADVLIARGEGSPDVVLHFWATWCPDCVEELPVLERAAKACDSSRVRVIAVNAGEDAEQVRSFLAEHALTLPVLLDSGGKAWRKAGLWGIPSNLLWTAEGLRTIAGPSSARHWRKRLAGLGCDGAAPREPVRPTLFRRDPPRRRGTPRRGAAAHRAVGLRRPGLSRAAACAARARRARGGPLADRPGGRTQPGGAAAGDPVARRS